ncbi:2TM domain-containing protein [Hymenobacter gummosus]|uniref:2TM domain-containing protein n=1 Tax=Hymenobacter gummosus TaxID=1776032 RepID=A0A3S0JI95_9BACT|nr:2TM domain-containing protein [Hymenobacter gummosus]RTQ50781.1 2TM domain-containing protein [Hymenobacter gummosus]
MNPQDRNARLWNLAQNRAQFKVQLLLYVLVSAVLWAVWYFTGHRMHGQQVPWPAWIMLFWGLGLAIKGFASYGLLGTDSWSEREYQQLLREREAGQR